MQKEDVLSATTSYFWNSIKKDIELGLPCIKPAKWARDCSTSTKQKINRELTHIMSLIEDDDETLMILKFAITLIDASVESLSTVKCRIEELNNVYRRSAVQDNVLALYYIQCAYLLGNVGKFSEQIELCNEAARLRPSWTSIYVNRAFAYYSMNEYQQGVNSLDIALTYDDRGRLFYWRAIMYERLTKTVAAVADIRRGITQEADYEDQQESIGYHKKLIRQIQHASRCTLWIR